MLTLGNEGGDRHKDEEEDLPNKRRRKENRRYADRPMHDDHVSWFIIMIDGLTQFDMNVLKNIEELLCSSPFLCIIH